MRAGGRHRCDLPAKGRPRRTRGRHLPPGWLAHVRALTRRRLARPVAAAALVLVAGVVLLVVVMRALPPTGAERRALPARMAVGVTHTQYSADHWQPRQAVNRAVRVLNNSTDIQNQALMGWGATNPEPSPGLYDWESLDTRIDLMRRSPRSVMSITLCGAPDWMKGGIAGHTQWADLEKAPSPEHYDDFASLAATVALRYPDVEYFFVWNELKGFYNTTTNNWDIAAYTDLYNRVYRAVKAVRPTARVGGPYVVMDSWSSPEQASHASTLRGPWGVVDGRTLAAVQYWLAHKTGADFIALDGQSDPRDGRPPTTDTASTEKFTAITRWVRQRTTLPLWWAELYPDPSDPTLPPQAPRRAQLFAKTLAELKAAGADGVLLWQPEARSTLASVALWNDTGSPEGGTPLPLVLPLQWLRRQWNAGATPSAAFTGPDLTLTGPTEVLTLGADGVTTVRPPARSGGG